LLVSAHADCVRTSLLCKACAFKSNYLLSLTTLLVSVHADCERTSLLCKACTFSSTPLSMTMPLLLVTGAPPCPADGCAPAAVVAVVDVVGGAPGKVR